MPNLVTTTPIPFDDTVLPFTKTDSFLGAGLFEFWANAGPYESGGKLWRVCLNVAPTSGMAPANFLNCYSSSDGGNTWIEQDSTHRPQLTTLHVADAPRVDVTFGHDGIFYILVALSGTVGGTNLSVQRFNTGSATWLSAFTGPLTNTGAGLVNDISIYQNSTNADLLILYDRTSGLDNTIYWGRFAAGVFGAENVLRASALNNFAGLAVIDSGNVARVFFQDAGVSTYQPINPDDSLGSSVITGWNVGTGSNVVIYGKPVIWQGAIAMPAAGNDGTSPQPFGLIASPASLPATFTAAEVFSEPVSGSIIDNDNGLRVMIDGANALWLAWQYFSHSPGSSGDPVTVSHIGMAQLCSQSATWGNHQVFWDQLTDPQTDQPLNDADAIQFFNFSLTYIPSSDTFGGIANIAGFNNTYAYYLQSSAAAMVSRITACGEVKKCLLTGLLNPSLGT